jgi:hypothetical protein
MKLVLQLINGGFGDFSETIIATTIETIKPP